MSIQPSKQVTDRQKSSEVVQGTRVHLDAVGEALAARITPEAPEAAAEVRGAVRVLGQHLLAWLGANTRGMVAADEANAQEQADDAGLRTRRDAAAALVTEHLASLRDVARVYFGETVVVQLTVPSALPSDPVVLHRTGLAVLKNLRDFVPPAPRMASMKFVNAEWLALLEPPVADLGAALEAIAVDRKENELALAEKHRAMTAYDEAFRGATLALMGVFTAAGRDDLAERVRPSQRRPGQTAENAENPAPPTV